jgi:peptidoglycan hydrolase-like protein with peptidoglycan-binding domain
MKWLLGVAIGVLAAGFSGAASAQNDFMKSEAVILLVEYQLSDLGYDPGEIDGVFDDAARTAVLAFEKAEGLPQDGYITDPLLNRMDELLAMQKSNDDVVAKRADDGPLWIVGIDPDGTKARGVKRGSIADEFLHMKAGDVILKFDGEEVRDLDHLVKLFEAAYNRLNTPVTLLVQRDGAEIELTGELGHFYDDGGMPMPDEPAQPQ